MALICLHIYAHQSLAQLQSDTHCIWSLQRGQYQEFKKEKKRKVKRNDRPWHDITESKCSRGTRILLFVFHQQNCIPVVLGCNWVHGLLMFTKAPNLYTLVHDHRHGWCQLNVILQFMDLTAHTRKLMIGWCSMYRVFYDTGQDLHSWQGHWVTQMCFCVCYIT